MLNRNLVVSVIAVFAFILLYEWVLHGILLESAYRATAALWRTPEDMKTHFPWLLAGQASLAVFITLLYYGFVRDRRLGNGLRFGLIIGLFFASPYLVDYAVTPIPLSLVISWIAATIVEYFLIGGLLAATCRGTQPPETRR